MESYELIKVYVFVLNTYTLPFNPWANVGGCLRVFEDIIPGMASHTETWGERGRSVLVKNVGKNIRGMPVSVERLQK
jgi:hypothetical protein